MSVRSPLPESSRPDLVQGGSVAMAMMAKVPQAGKVKTRLVPPLTPQEAAGLHEAFLRDLIACLTEVCSGALLQGFIVYSPAACEAALEGIVPHEIKLIPQRGDRLEERVIHAAEDLFSLGYRGVCLLNADSPTLPPKLLREAAEALMQPGERIVLGPAEDGGYYLIGMKHVYVRAFEGIDWSTSRVFAQTLERAAELGLPVTRLAPAYDVDDAPALRRLCTELFPAGTKTGSHARMSSIAPHSQEFLRALLDNGGVARLGWHARDQ